MKVQTEQSKFDTDEHILVCLSSSPSNARIIHTAAKMAKVLHARFTAIYVQTDTVINDEDQSRLSQNIQLAQRLGAEIVMTHGENVALQISEYVRLTHLQSEKTDVISVMEMVGIMLLPTDIHQRKKRGEAMTENKIIIPIWKKSNLTVEEAAAYCGIGSRKLREMSDSEFCPFVLWNGSKRLIKRRKLDEYLDNAYSI